MYRYLVLIWNPKDDAASASARRISQRIRELQPEWWARAALPGFSAFDAASHRGGLTAYELPNGSGVVYGRLFRNVDPAGSPTPLAALSDEQTEKIVSSRGRSLIEDYWGAYVAFLYCRRARETNVIRDCSGRIPCFMADCGGVTLLFSRMSDLACLDLTTFSFNWKYLRSFLCATQMQVRETALQEVTELLAGECLAIGNSQRTTSTIWNPRPYCIDRSIEEYEDAVTLLRTATQQGVDAWAQVQDPILHSLSGGFDSAVVLGCLSRSPGSRTVSCFTRFAENPGEDERRYARLAANLNQVDLLERPWQGTKRVIDARILCAPLTSKPSLSMTFGMLDIENVNDIVRAHSADVIWTGQGGDHLFLHSNSSDSATDFATRRGLRKGLSSAVLDAARLSREPFLTVYLNAIAARFSEPAHKRVALPEPQYCFVLPDSLPADLSEYVAHPWTLSMDGIPPGKQLQVLYLSELVNRHRPQEHVAYAEEHHPLVCQPLIEASLRIPTYLLLRGGRPRSLARHTFASYVPIEIEQRKDKGGVSTNTLSMVRSSQQFLEGLLLDGILAREKIVDTAAIEAHLCQCRPIRAEQYFQFIATVAAESWLRIWTSSALRPAP